MKFSVLVEEWEGGEKSLLGKVEDSIIDVHWEETKLSTDISLFFRINDENIENIFGLSQIGVGRAESFTVRYLDGGDCIGNTSFSQLYFKSISVSKQAFSIIAEVKLVAKQVAFAKVKFVL